MDVRRLRYFLAIARAKSFSRAASQLRIAQPALSSQIAALEAELETQLFLRHSRGVELTEAGRVLLPRADDILHRIEQAAQEIRALGKLTTFEVRIGLPTTMTGIIAIPLMDAFSATHPEIVLHIVEGMTGHLEKWMEQDDIDIAILYDKPASGRTTFASIGYERLVLIGRDTGVFTGRDTVTFQDLANLPLIHTTRAHQLRRMIDNYCMEMRVPLNLLAEIDSLAQIRTLLSSAGGYTILPESISHDWRIPELRSWPFVRPELNIRHHLIHSPRYLHFAKAKIVLEVIVEVATQLIESGQWLGATLHAKDSADAKTLADAIGR
jgi:LysR family transcriptional regulator, nitrogen assimilation regulatory protein